MMRGERKAKGASKRMCRSPCPSRSAISAKEPMRPRLMSSIHPRAFAIAMSKASRLSGFIAGFAQGACTMPFTAAKLGAVQGKRDRGRWVAGSQIIEAVVFSLSRCLARGNEADYQCLRLDDHACD